MSVWQASLVSVGENVKRLRAERGWTIDQLADLSTVDKEQISLIERGEAKAQARTAKKFADAFGVPVRDVLSDTPSPQPDAKPVEVARKEARVPSVSVQLESKTSPDLKGAHDPPFTKEGHGMHTTITAAEMQMLGAVRRLRGRAHDDFIDTVTEMAKQVRKARPKPRRLVHSP